METLLQDLRWAVRTLAKVPGFTAIALLTLALGIGANTAIFSVVNGVLLNPLPFPHPEELVTLHESKPNFPTGSISYPNFRDWQKANHAFAAMAIGRDTGYKYSSGNSPAEQIRGGLISSDYFSVLGVKPVIGRLFAPGEDEPHASPIALLDGGFWSRKFGSSPEVLGKSITLDGKDYTIVGVIPAGFRVELANVRAIHTADVYIPIGQWSNPFLVLRTAGLGIHGIARLKPGVTLAQAQADMDTVTRSLAAEYPNDDKGVGASMIPLKQDILGKVEPSLFLLLGAVGFVLLIACVNVANLLLARSTARTREFAVRAALGASKGRLVRQLLTESVLLGIGGGTIGLLLAVWGTQAGLRVIPGGLPRASEVKLDTAVLIFTMLISLLAGVFFGLAPALRIGRTDLHDALKEGTRGAGGGRHRTQQIFVVAEVALALVLLVGSGLMIRTLAALWGVNPGFHSKNVLTFDLGLPPSFLNANADAVRAELRQLDRQMESIHGVEAVSLSSAAFPLSGDDEALFWYEGQPKPASQSDMNWTIRYVVEPGYLKTMGIPLQRGRFITEQDNERAPLVAVVDETFAHKFFANQDPIGKRINLLGPDKPVEIVGVVGHVNQWGLDSDESNALRAQMYLPYMQLGDDEIKLVPLGTSVILRHSGSGKTVFDAVRSSLQQMNSDNVVYDAETMDEIIAGTLETHRFSMMILAAFAALALLLSTVGIYGVISYIVGHRTREIGVRMALGAQPKDVLRLVLGQGVNMALIGVAIGLAAAVGLTRLMSSLLFGVKPTDPVTFAGVAILLAVVALTACYMPARRAARVDPLTALRHE